MILARQVLAIVLVMTMVATTGSMAAMRDRDAGTQAMVICNGAGLQTILLDANGERVDPAPICPDCTMVVLAPAPASPDVILCDGVAGAALWVALAAPMTARNDRGGPQARAPPVG
ncbi:hypothetical protein [Litoreibacter arenae]|uniref:Secreted protein n=1 Tax=Litoreibacter arenae DSM 19593 TaxID=1123360 RepID=S9QMQ9_9RHOB|nr:hypothetical protein [Litoreibacter arenae]EPX80888.1 hypothetical protein thalar_01110 [Litoreibacter arenae DSM 19593]